MKRAFVLFAALVLVAGCSKSTTAPAADDNRAQFTAALLASSEVPPIAGAESTAAGTANIDFNLTKDAAGAITAATVHFRVDMTGFAANSAITNAHIHTGAAGVAGGVLVAADVAAGQVTLTGGVGTFSRLSIVTTAANAQAIINNPAGFYFNVHSSANPTGVIRGQLVRK